MNWLRAHWRPLAAGLAVLLAFALGRFFRPVPRIEYRERVVYREKEAAHVEQAAHAEAHQTSAATSTASLAAHHRVHRTRTVHTLPSGETLATTETTVDDGLTLETAQEVVVELQTASLILGALDASRTASASREVEVVQTPEEAPRWGLTALVGLAPAGPVYGGQGSYRVVGPIWLRAQVTAGAHVSGVVGVGVEF